MNTPEERGWFQSVLTLGYQDAFRVLHPDVRRYTWWRSFKQNWSFLKGFRLDYILIPTTIPTTALLRCSILASYRYLDNPSDHAPLLLTYRYDPPVHNHGLRGTPARSPRLSDPSPSSSS
jgi:exodeoxyribonuclease-3